MLSKGEVYFGLFGNGFEPDAVTKIIGVEPTSVDRESIPRPKQSAWRFSSGRVESEVIDVYELAASVTSTLKPFVAKIKEAKNQFNLEAFFAVVLWISTEEGDSTPTIGFDTQVVKFLSEVGASIDVDTYLLSPR